MSHVKRLLPAVAFLIGGCTGSGETRELTSDEKVLVDRLFTIGDLGDKTLEGLLGNTDLPFYTAEGKEVDAAEYIEDLAHVRAEVKEMHKNGEIVGFSEEDYVASKNAPPESMSAEAFASEDLHIIALNVDFSDSWSTGILFHEGGHILSTSDDGFSQGHAPELFQFGTFQSKEFLQAIWGHQDYSNIISASYFLIDKAMMDQRYSAESEASHIFEQVKAGEISSDEALAEYDSEKYTSAEDWAESFRTDGTLNKDGYYREIMDFFSITDDQFVESFKEGDLFAQVEKDWEVQREILRENLREFDETQAERKAELRARLEPPRRVFR